MLPRVNPLLKRILLGLAAVVVLLAVAAGGVFYSAFGKNRPIVEGTIAPGVEIAKDSYVSVAILDAGQGRVALVDCGTDEGAKSTLAALGKRGLDASAVAGIFLTHGHPDHTAGCRVFPRAEVYAMPEDVELVGGAAKVTHPLKDGEVVQVGELKVEAFATPGHTAGSAVYFARGVLFFGDSARGAKDGSMMAAVGPFSKSAQQNRASLVALAARLEPRASEVKTLAFAHSGPLEGFAPLGLYAQAH
jgi:glyoxylase-like metal-dependent hydrolase (beta-lactamase superfamily II)